MSTPTESEADIETSVELEPAKDVAPDFEKEESQRTEKGEEPESQPRYKRKFKTLAVAALLGVLGYASSIIWTIPFREATRLPWLEPSSSSILLMNYTSLALAAITIGVLYFYVSDKDMSYIDMHIPDKKQLFIITAGTVTLLVGFYLVATTTTLFEGGASQHTIQQTVGNENIDPRFILLMIPISILVIGPSEEFIFRNLVQKRLYEDFSKASSIAIASLIFAVVHYPAYATGTLSQITVSLLAVFTVSTVFGTAYAWTENLLVPSLMHGTYNAVLFANWYTALALGYTFI